VLADHDAGEVDVRAWDGRHDRRIGHAGSGLCGSGNAGRPLPSDRLPGPSGPCRRAGKCARNGRSPCHPRPASRVSAPI
jgi:hypothetical protein